MQFSIYQESRQGQRSSNQDRIGYLYTHESGLLIVCDGMGGHHRGEVASTFVVEFLAKAFRQAATPRVEDPPGFLVKAIAAAHAALIRYAEHEKMVEVPRTTCVAAVVQDGKVSLASVGDSRIYMVRGNRLVARTTDHSHVQNLIDRGEITEEQAMYHPERNKIFNCIGQPTMPRIDIKRNLPMRSNDTILLSTDGLWGPLPIALVCSAISRVNLQTSIPMLMDMAEAYSGRECDNLSAVGLTWVGDGSSGKDSPPDVAQPLDMNSRAIDDEDLEIALSAIRGAINRRAIPQS